MAKQIGLNVALKLNTMPFATALQKAKDNANKFARDLKRQNEIAGKFGAAGLGRGFGIAGGVLEGLSMGGVAGGLTGVVAGLAGMAMSVKAVMSAIDGLNKAAMDARKTMQQVAEGKAPPGMVSGFTPPAAKAVTTQVQTDIFSEALASNLAPRSLEDAIRGYVVSAAPNVWRAWAAESINIMADAMMGRQSGPAGQRMQAAAVAAVAGDLGPAAAQTSARNLEAIRRGQQQQTEVLRGN
jgi:hypothetical protein